MKQLIVNADDLGICEATNRAIAEAFRRGILTSTSLMANGPAFEHALEHVVRPNPKLGVGLHVCLVGAKSLLAPDKLPLLVDDQGEFSRGFVSLLKLTLIKRRAVVDEIEREVAAQFEALLAHGVQIDHVDSHRHVHMIPAVFRIVVRLAQRYGCPAVRVSHEPLPRLSRLLLPARLLHLPGNMAKKLILSALARRNRSQAAVICTPDRVVGVLDSGRMDVDAVSAGILSAADGVTEIITHPGGENPEIPSNTAAMDRKFLLSPARHSEFLALVENLVREQVNRTGCRLVRYADLVECAHRDLPATATA